jgi:hypothetical protein
VGSTAGVPAYNLPTRENASVATTTAATQIYREAQGWVQVPPDAADAEAKAAFVRWLAADSRHLPAYERALMERGRNDAVNQKVEAALDKHAEFLCAEAKFWRRVATLFGGATLTVDICFLVVNQTFPKTTTDLLIFLVVRLLPLIVLTVGAYLFAPHIYAKVRHARDANALVRVAMRTTDDPAMINTVLASALGIPRNLVMTPEQTTEAREAMRVARGGLGSTSSSSSGK